MCSRACQCRFNATVAHGGSKHSETTQAIVRKLYDEDYTYRDIGIRAGISASQVARLVVRLRLEPRRPSRPKKYERHTPGVVQEAPDVSDAQPDDCAAVDLSFEPPRAFPPDARFSLPPEPIPPPRGCQWIDGQRPYVMCGAPLFRGSWCERHFRIVYVGRGGQLVAA